MPRIIFDCAHADTCLPDYWGGHHLPHVQITVIPGMTMRDIKNAITYELRMGYVVGSTDHAIALSDDFVDDEFFADKVTRSAYAAVNRLKPAKKGQRKFFTDVDSGGTDGYSVYAYFVFVERE